MKLSAILVGALGALAVASGASAATNLVSNGSFEILPGGGLNQTGCGANCAYSFSDQGIPKWKINDPYSENTGQFTPGAYPAFNYIPDGVTVAYSNDVGATISQDLGPVSVGTTYDLSAYLGSRSDYPSIGLAQLYLGSTLVATATGTAPALGDWSQYTASYIAPIGASGDLSVVLTSTGVQSEFDAISVSVPEPATWAMMLLGVGMIGAGLRMARRKNDIALTAA